MKKLLFLIAGWAIAFVGEARACPAVNGIPDFNCDGDVVIVIMGDSLAYGFGDTRNGNRGGYALRLQRALPAVEVLNFGEQGLHTGQLLLELGRVFRGNGSSQVRDGLLRADIVILDVGRNDRWDFGPPAATYRNLKRAASIIKEEVKAAGQLTPYIITAVLMLPNRGSQGPWVADLNKLIRRGSNAANPADLRFDLVSKRLLSSDQIHPTPAGYDALFKTLVSYLKKTAAPRMRKLRPDGSRQPTVTPTATPTVTPTPTFTPTVVSAETPTPTATQEGEGSAG